MAFNIPGVPFKLTAADMGGLGGFDLGEAISSGLNNAKKLKELRFQDRNLENEALSVEQANQMKAPYAQNAERVFNADIGGKENELSLAPLRKKLLEAQASRQQQLANQPYGGNLSGIAREAYGIAQITGQDPKEIAQKLYQNKLEQAQALNSYREALTSSAPKRASTQLGKLEQEQQEVEAGFLPGSNGQVRLNPQQQQALTGHYQLAKQKLSSDVDTRKKLLYATNLDKTLDRINVNDLTRYSGIAGGLEKKIAEGKSLSGSEQKEYESYQDSLTAAKLLAKQVRQFYGDSITPAIQEQLSELINPSAWKLNPKVAKNKFNQFKSILQSETQTYRDALMNNSVYGHAPANLNNNESLDPLGIRE